MKERVLAVALVFFLMICGGSLAEPKPFGNLFSESRNELSVIDYEFEYDTVATGDILLQGKVALLNNSDVAKRVYRVCLTVGVEGIVDETVAMTWQERMTYLYTGNRPEDKPFVYIWEQMLVDMSVFDSVLQPGEQIEVAFATILQNKKDVDRVEVVLQDLCFDE